MAQIAARANQVQPRWKVIGFVAPPGHAVTGSIDGLPVLQWPAALEDYPEAGMVPDYGWPQRQDLPRERLVSLVDPSTFVGPGVILGAGCVVYPHCFIGAGAGIGDLLFCLSHGVINHDDLLEDRVTLAAGASLAGGVHVEAGCYLGQGCLVRQNLRLGRDSLIGMGAVVVADVEPESVMIGNPARCLRRNT
jgi:acyl-[acyl carrier protein]--UDP-N-acetylglucosamine O-acyltransferase